MTTLDKTTREAMIKAAEELILDKAALGLSPGTDELVDAVIDALSALPAQPVAVNMDWRPFETKPTDGYGGPFEVYWPSREIGIGVIPGGYTIGWLEPNYQGLGWAFRTQMSPHNPPTHWRPLPGPAEAAHVDLARVKP